MIQAEMEVISALLIDASKITKVYKLLSSDMFESPRYGMIYGMYLSAYDSQTEVSYVDVMRNLMMDGMPEAEARQFIKECLDLTLSWMQIENNAILIRDEYRARKVSEILNNTRPNGTDIEKCIRETIADLEKLTVDVEEVDKPLSQIVDENKDKYFKDVEKPRLNMGLTKLDEAIGGIEGGDVVIIAARPAVGKSAFALQIIRQFAKDGKKVAYFNLEMREKQVYERFVAAVSGIELNRIRLATTFLGNERERFNKANEDLKKQTSIIIHSGSKRVSDIRAETRGKGYDVIVIDYLQLLKSNTKRGANRYAEVGDISRGVKDIAMDYNIPVIALSQLNRASEGKEDKEPFMSDLRESGDIEQDASVIIMLWNTDIKDKSRKMIKVEKARQGTTSKQELTFDGRYMTFSEEGFRPIEGNEDMPFD